MAEHWKIAVVCFAQAVAITFIYALARATNYGPVGTEVLGLLGVSFGILAWSCLLACNSARLAWAFCGLLALLSGLSYLGLPAQFTLWSLGGAGYVGAGILLHRNRVGVSTAWPYALIGGMLGTWTALRNWSIGELSPYFEQRLLVGTANADSMYHITVSNLLRTFPYPTTGMDGAPFHQYHVGSHWLLARLAELFGISSVQAYNLGVPLLLYPLLTFWLLGFAQGMREHVWKNTAPLLPSVPVFLLAGLIGWVPFWIGPRFYLWHTVYESESYLLSTIFFLVIAATAIPSVLACERKRLPRLVWIFPFLCGLVGLVKISAMVLLMGMFAYTVVRWLSLRNWRVYTLGLLSALVFFFVFRLISPQENIADASSRGMLFLPFVSNIGYRWPIKLLYYPIYYFFSLIYFYLRLRTENALDRPGLRRAWRERRLLDCELLAVLCVLGEAPGTFFELMGGNGVYFADVQSQVSLALLCGLPVFFKFLARWRERHFVLLAAFCLPLALNFYGHSRDFARDYMGMRVQSAAARSQPAAYSLQENLFATLRELSTLPHQEKRQTLLYFPRDLTEFWSHMNCWQISLYPTAVTGIALLDGVPTKDCPAVRHKYGYSAYGIDRFPYLPAGASDPQLCTAAQALGFSQIVNFDSFLRKKTYRKINCAP